MSLDVTPNAFEHSEGQTQNPPTEMTEADAAISKPDTDRASKVKDDLKQKIVDFNNQQEKIAELLQEVHDQCYWKPEHESFSQYVEAELGLTHRTAQELIKVNRKLNELGIDPKETGKIGWSKLAIAVSHLTRENSQDMLRDLKGMTFREVRNQYQPPKKKLPRKSDKDKAQTNVQLTPIIMKALSRAGQHTKQEDPQFNLEFLAEKFLESCPPPKSTIDQIPSLN